MRWPSHLVDLGEAVALVLANPYVCDPAELGRACDRVLAAADAVPETVASLVESGEAPAREARKLLYALGHVWARDLGPQPTLPSFVERHATALGRARLDSKDLRRVLAALRRFYGAIASFVGDSPAARQVRAKTWSVCFGGGVHETLSVLRRIRATSVLILGETGTGKELVAEALHAGGIGLDADTPLPRESINAANLTPELAASELFGHERGAFTGAHTAKAGRIEQANGGSLFLDEIGELPTSVRGQLLRAIATGQVSRLGSNKTVHVHVRYFSATWRPLEQMAEREEYPRDLYARLAGSTIYIPPLRERPEDVAPIGRALVEKHRTEGESFTTAGELRRRLVSVWLDVEAARLPWPCNVRDLESEISKRLLGFPMDKQHNSKALPVGDRVPTGIADGKVKEAHLLDWYRTLVLERTGGNQRRAAAILGISEDKLQRWKKELKERKG